MVDVVVEHDCVCLSAGDLVVVLDDVAVVHYAVGVVEAIAGKKLHCEKVEHDWVAEADCCIVDVVSLNRAHVEFDVQLVVGVELSAVELHVQH